MDTDPSSIPTIPLQGAQSFAVHVFHNYVKSTPPAQELWAAQKCMHCMWIMDCQL